MMLTISRRGFLTTTGAAAPLDPKIIKGDDYRKFLKDNEQATKRCS
jgi:hypothetical protein